jgi:hypothetical protein
MAAGAALQANIRTQAGNKPFVSAAGMRLPQADDVVELQVREHVGKDETGRMKDEIGGKIIP